MSFTYLEQEIQETKQCSGAVGSMSRFSERYLSQMASETSRPNVFRLGGGAFANIHPFTIPASATYMTDIGIFEDAQSLPNANFATIGDRDSVRPIRSAFRLPPSTFPSLIVNYSLVHGLHFLAMKC